MAAVLLVALSVSAQTMDNKSLTGKYFFRHLSLAAGNVGDARTLTGAVTFDGSGNFSVVGQQTVGAGAPAAATASGTYSVDAAGFVSLSNPTRTGSRIDARLGPEALLGSSTDPADGSFDLFVAIPAPVAAASNATLNGGYWAVALELPGGSASAARNTIFGLAANGQGKFADFQVSGHAAGVSGGQPTTQAVAGAVYAIAADGTGSATFGAAPAALLSGARAIYVSKSGNVILGGSAAAGGHDLLIGVKGAAAVSNSSWNATYWGAGLRLEPGGISAYAGAVAARGAGKLIWTRRLKAQGVGALDFTGVNAYSLKPDGSGKAELAQVGLGANAFVLSTIDAADAGAYEIGFGVPVPSLTGAGVFLNPLGVVNAASYAPAGNPISPGEFIALYGTGLAPGEKVSAPPYPLNSNGVTVLVNGKAAPLYYVSPGQVNALVPYATQGSTATVAVQNAAGTSNTVTMRLAAATPGVFSMDRSGTGPGAVLHADYGLVNSDRPATPGEVVLVYLSGMGAVTPPVADGAAAGAYPLSQTDIQAGALIGGLPAEILYKGLAPGFPGLYQLNVRVPLDVPASGNLPLAIQTPTAFHDQVDIVVAR